MGIEVTVGYNSDNLFVENINLCHVTRVGLRPDRIAVSKKRVYVGIVYTFKNITWGKMFQFKEEWYGS